MLADVSSYIEVGALVKILLISLVAGAGLTAVFSFGVSALSKSRYGGGTEADGTGVARSAASSSGSGGLVIAVICFLIDLAGIGYGISVALTK
jgi:hypothetical protein